MTAEKVHAGIAVAMKGFAERGWEADVCFIRPDETAGPIRTGGTIKPMTTQQVLIVGGTVGLLVSSVVLALLWFGVSGVLIIGKTDLMYVFWPSSVMLVTGWRSTIPGMMITASSVVINCLLYMAFAYALLRLARLVRT